MKKITLLLAGFLAFATLAQAQKNPPQKAESKSMEEQMKELKKQMESMDPETRKAMEEMGMFDLLKQAEKTTKAAEQKGVNINAMAAADPQKIPAKPSGLPIAAAPVSKEQLKAYLQPMLKSTEAALKPESKAEANKYLNKGAETGQAAMAFLIKKEWDKTLYLLLHACIANPEDYASLNNLGAMITMAGYAHKSLPVLQYVQKQFPQSPTLLGNMGQAWLSLGHLDKAEKMLKDALDKDEENSEAALSLAVINRQQGNTKQCAAYAQKAIEGGCISPEAISMLMQADPNADIAGYIRKRFKPYYKDHAITKRFRPPLVPASYDKEEMGKIKKFYADLDVTVNETSQTTEALMETFEARQQQIMQNMSKDLMNPSSFGNLAGYNLKYNHPFKAGATVMRGAMANPTLNTSFAARMQQEKDFLKKQEAALNQSLSKYGKQITSLSKQMDKLEGGENGEEEEQVQSLQKQICIIGNIITREYNSGVSKIRNEYMGKMEYLLSQQLQEDIFWNNFWSYPNDPTGPAYQSYLAYLKGIASFKYLYTDINDTRDCDNMGSLNEETPVTGELRQWEIDHCDFKWGLDAHLLGTKIDCEGWSVYGRIGPVKFGYGETTNPVTFQTTSHTVHAELGYKKEFGVGKRLTGEVGATVGGSVTFDGGGNVVDAGVKGSVGAGVSGPLGGSAGGDLASGEYTLRGGFNGAGPSVNSPGSSFLRGN